MVAVAAATGATDAGTMRGGRRVAGRIYRRYDLRTQLAAAAWRAVRAWSISLYGGAAKRGRAVATGRMSQVRAAILD